jgi:protein dithiol oxidoreductase (disulfide-forming)
MNVLRRKALAAAPFLLTLAASPLRALAQDTVPAEGKEYRAVSPPLAPESKTKVEVIEFFSYACPHCYAFEPVIEPWIAKLPPVVTFTRVPVLFYESWVPLARLYYTLDALGEVKRLHGTVFDAIHKEHQRLIDEAGIGAFLEKQGVPRKKFTDAWNSFSVQSRMPRVAQLLAAYNIDAVPEIAVDGRYVTSNTMVGGSHEAVLPVVDYLIAQARKTRKL